MKGFKKLKDSFKYALNGIKSAVQFEKNFQIEFVLGFISIVLGIFLHINTIEWLTIVGCNALVLSLELINTAIEKICNFIHAEYHPAIKLIKDISAGAVLVVAFASAIIGCIIFLPKIILLF